MIYIRTLVIEHKPENLLMSKIKFGLKLMVPDIVYIIQMICLRGT
jgi:hypothetical protein